MSRMGASNIQEKIAGDNDVLGSKVRVSQRGVNFEDEVPFNLEELSTKRRKVERTAIFDDSQSEQEGDSEQTTLAVSLVNDPLNVLQHLMSHGSEVDLVNDRLSVLQHLIPHGLEFEGEEILNVVADYVKSLEKVIETFSKSRHVGAVEQSANQNTGVDAANDGSETLLTSKGDTLQKRGLCVVPLSSFAKAF